MSLVEKLKPRQSAPLVDSAEAFGEPEAPSEDERLADARRMVGGGLSARIAANEAGVPLDEAKAIEDEGRLPWLPSNFKTPEALVASYKQLERKLTEQGQELATLRADLAEAQSADPEALRAALDAHRAAFFAEWRAQAEELLALDTRVEIAEQLTDRVELRREAA